MSLLCAERARGHWLPLPSRLTKCWSIFMASVFIHKARHDQKQSLGGGRGLAAPGSRRRSLPPGTQFPGERPPRPAGHPGTDLSEGGTARVLELSPFQPWTRYLGTAVTSQLYTLATPLSKILTRGDIAGLFHPPTRRSGIGGKPYVLRHAPSPRRRGLALKFLTQQRRLHLGVKRSQQPVEAMGAGGSGLCPGRGGGAHLCPLAGSQPRSFAKRCSRGRKKRSQRVSTAVLAHGGREMRALKKLKPSEDTFCRHCSEKCRLWTSLREKRSPEGRTARIAPALRCGVPPWAPGSGGHPGPAHA